jgi:hypothetical protein
MLTWKIHRSHHKLQYDKLVATRKDSCKKLRRFFGNIEPGYVIVVGYTLTETTFFNDNLKFDFLTRDLMPIQ